MTPQTLKSLSNRTIVRLSFGAIVGLFIGIMGGVAERPFIGVLSAGCLALLLASFQAVFHRTLGIFSGITSGAILGVIIAIGILATGGSITNWQTGLQFGLLRGMLIGSAAGFLTRPAPDKGDPIHVRLFLIFAATFIGVALGGVVGLITGYFLGILQMGWFSLILAALLGLLVGTFLASYLDDIKIIIAGGLFLALLTTLGQLIGGAISGVFLGAISGTIAPMLLMGIIGAYGGVTRGPMAILKEAIETPREMLIQGAVPMLAPSIILGLIIGTAAYGIGAILVIPTVLAVVGLLLGAFGEIEGRNVNQVTPKAIVEIIIVGSDKWPIERLLKRLRVEKAAVLKSAIIGFLLGIGGSLIGVLVGQWLTAVMTNL